MTTEKSLKPNLLSSIILRPRRVYKCVCCDHILPRKHVYKDKDGIYRCNTDHAIVEDITNRETGHDFMEIVNL